MPPNRKKFGSLPRIIESELKNGEVEVLGTIAYVTPVLYFTQPTDEQGRSLIGYHILDAYWPGKTFNGMPEPPETADKLAESFQKGYHSGGYPEPIAFDRGHATQDEGTEPTAPAYLVDVIATSVPTRTYDSETGQEVTRTMPSGQTRVLAGKIAVLPRGEAELAGRQLPGVSIVYNNTDGNLTLKNPAFVLNPASKFLPPLVFERHFTDKNGIIIKSDNRGGSMDPSRMNVKKMDSNSPTYQPLLVELQNTFGQGSVAAQDIVGYLTEEEAQSLLKKMQGTPPATPANPPATPAATPETPKAEPTATALTKEDVAGMIKTEVSGMEARLIEFLKKDKPKDEEEKKEKVAVGYEGAKKALHAIGKSDEEIEQILKSEKQYVDVMTVDEATAFISKKYGKKPDDILKGDNRGRSYAGTLSGLSGKLSGVIRQK